MVLVDGLCGLAKRRHHPPSPAFLDNYATPAFRRTDLISASAPFIHNWINDDGPQTPGGPFPWLTASFPIASGATDVPPGWVLNAPPELNYTWQDLMHNIDGIRFFVVNPEDITFDSCWHLGADNVVVTYGDTDTILHAIGAEAGVTREIHEPLIRRHQP